MDAIESARHFDCDAVKAYLKGVAIRIYLTKKAET